MIPIMMISEIPFPMPFSVMRSPSHITKTVPAVSTMTVEIMKKLGLITMACPVAPYCRLTAKAMACMAVIPTVP